MFFARFPMFFSLFFSINHLCLIGLLFPGSCSPIIPISSEKVLGTINISKKDITIENINKNILDNDKELKNLDILFKKIEHDN